MRLVDEAVKANGGSGAAPTLINGATSATPQPIKLLTTNPATFVDGLIPVSTNGPIELAAK